MVELSTQVAGVKLKNPLVVGAGPNTKSFRAVSECIKAGFGAVVVRSLHRQHLSDPVVPLREFWNVYCTGKNYLKAAYSFQSTGGLDKQWRENIASFAGSSPEALLEGYAEEVLKIKNFSREFDCAVIASIGWCGSNLSDEDVWKTEAKLVTEAGVDAIQLHTGPSPATEPGRYMSFNHKKYLEMPIKAVKKVSGLPVFAKIPVDCCDTVGLAGIAQTAGADGIVPVTRWTSISVDVEAEKKPALRGPGYGGPWSVPIMNGLIYRMRNPSLPIGYGFSGLLEGFPGAVPVTVPVIPSGGVRHGSDVIGYLMAGANAAEICAQAILEGVGVAGRIEKEIRNWMERKGYRGLSEFQGTLKLMDFGIVTDESEWLPKIDEDRCTACEKCVVACPNGAVSLKNSIAVIDEPRCEGCRTCYYVCPTDAIAINI
jgi:dihydroorotate dehydrogenase/Pyruvate/2-oxoacid:ferredoxin oxidoreductase delta subunit